MATRLSKRQKKQLRRQNIYPQPTFKEHFRIRRIHPATENQQIAFEAYEDGSNLLLHGLPGTGKTFVSMYLALEQLLEQGLTSQRKLVIIRSVVPTRDIGFLPGNVKQKSQVYELPYTNITNELFGRGDAYDILKQKGIIEFETTSFLRGITLDNSIVYVDEMNNMSFHELDSIITRMGKNSRILFSGDFGQSDLRSEEKNGLLKFMNVLKKLNWFEYVEFNEDDIVRSGIVKDYIITKHQLGYGQALCA